MATTLTPPQPAPSSHPVFTIVGVSLFSIALDIMHVFDLGVLQHLVGSLFYILGLARTIGWGGAVESGPHVGHGAGGA